MRKSITCFEHYQASSACPSEKSSINIEMNMEFWWNNTDRGKPKYSEKNLAQCHFVYHKSHFDILLLAVRITRNT
jgi:hypothetical protein